LTLKGDNAMMTIKSYPKDSIFNKVIDLNIDIRILLNMKERIVNKWEIIVPKEEGIDDVEVLVARELENNGINFILKLIQTLNNDQYNKLIEGT
jgi:F0F1-type ATP synthase delta subunit